MVFDTGVLNAVLLGLKKEKGAKEIPFCLLYDEEGSKLYNEITKLRSYYPFEAEKQLLEKHARDIATDISPGGILVELGCGSADKTPRLLNAIRELHGSCHYVGIDVSESALGQAAERLVSEVEGIQLESVRADYIDGLGIVRRKYPNSNLCVLWLGSSIGNIPRHESATFLNQVLKITGPRCQLFIGADMWKEEAVLRGAYDEKQGITELFIKNGMKHALKLLGCQVSMEYMQSWVYEVNVNSKLRQVEMYVRFPLGLHIAEHQIHISEDEPVLVEISRKFSADDMAQIASESGFLVHASWGSKVYISYLLLSSQEALLRCWKDTDELFEKVVDDWMAKPIPYRHPFCFYYGHVHAFAKLKLFKDKQATGLDDMFSRGVDPMVSDPRHCHKHPSVPANWPDKDSVMAYGRTVRALILEKTSDTTDGNMWLLNMVLEHERMHQETLCYMLVQQRKLAFDNSGNHHEALLMKNMGMCELKMPNVFIPSGTLVLGSDPKPGVFLWDNEQPACYTEVREGFLTSSDPVSVAEFMSFIAAGGYKMPELWAPDDMKLLDERKQGCPATWSLSRGEYFVHFLDGTRHWSQVAEQPVFVSLMEAEAFCIWRGCRIMSEPEYHRAVDEEHPKVQHLRDGGWEWTSTKFHPFPGFIEMEDYPEYSTDFFHGQHYVLKGSSPVTHPSMLRVSFRNFYQRQYPFVFAKFRCCK